MARRNAQPRSLVAAARRLDTAPATGTKIKVPRQEWQADAWDYYDAVPEVKHAARYVGNQLAKLRVYPAVPDPDDPSAPPIPVTDERSGVPADVAALAVAELARLRSDLGGQPEVLRQLAINMEVAGEAYIVGRAARTQDVTDRQTGLVVQTTVPERWEVHSVSEVVEKDGHYAIRGSEGGKAEPLGAEDTIIRVWQRHPRWADTPDCALAGLLVECEALHTLSLLIIGDSNSKRNNGFLLVPNEITFGSANATDSEDADPDSDPVLDALAETMQGPIADPSSPSSVQPTLVRGPAEALAQFRHVLATRPADTIDDKIEGRVKRLARGIDLPVEVVMGLEQTTFANAAQVDQDTFDDYLEPRSKLLCDALTFGFLTPQLEQSSAAAEWAGRILVHFDPSGLITQPDPAATAADAHSRNTISDAAYRRATGWSDDDAPDPEEMLRRTGLNRGILTGDITLALLKLLGIPIELAVPAEVPIDPATGEPQPIAASAMEAPPPRPHALTAGRTVKGRNTYGARLLGIDRDLRLTLTVAADAAMGRALERAGNRLRSKAGKLGVDRELLRHVGPLAVAATLGPALVAAADDAPLEGAWAELERQFREWGAAAQAEALDVAAQAAAGFSTAERTALQLRQAADLDEAWTWMRGSLDSLAQARMFDPTPGLALGEFDATMRVPTGLVRQAMARAGGATGLVTSGSDAWVALYPDGTPPGMIGTGELVGGALRDNGVGVEGYVWVYGPASRRHPFEPHMDLDGVTFVNFDDAVLANSGSFPTDAFYFPGDHAGCVCDYEPVIIPADE